VARESIPEYVLTFSSTLKNGAKLFAEFIKIPAKNCVKHSTFETEQVYDVTAALTPSAESCRERIN
jgi:hypothetical protein